MKNKISIIVLSVLFSIIIWGSVTLSEQFFTSQDVNVKVVNQPEGYSCGEVNPETLSLKIKAKGWQLLSLNLGSDLEYMVSAENDSGVFSIDPFNEINENRWISSGINVLEINPRNVSFKVEQLKFRKVRIEPVTDLTFSDGYGLATPIKIFPDSVVVAGPASLVDKMTSVKTKIVEAMMLDQKTAVISELETPTGFKLERNQVQLSFDVQKIVEKSFNNIKVVINDVPEDKEIVLLPNTVECNIRGGINILGKVSENQITAYINYREIVYDTLGSIQPELAIPENTTLVYIKPELLNYIIKKFK